MSGNDVKTFLYGCAVVCCVLAAINLSRRNRLYLGLAFLALAGTNVAYAGSLQMLALYIGGGITLALLLLDIWSRLGGKPSQ